MFIHTALKAKRWDGQSWQYAQVKLDGFRMTAFRGMGKQVVMFGKDHRPHLEFLHRFPRLKSTPFYDSLMRMPVKSSVDTEIIVPKSGKSTSSDVATALRNPQIPIVITPFAVPYYSGVAEYQRGLDWAEETLNRYGLTIAPWYSIKELRTKCNIRDITDPEDVRERLLQYADVLNYEGWVLKEFQYQGWYKVKHALMVDCIITGVNPGKGKFTGMIGALEVSLLLKNGVRVEVANVSGMTDAQRKTLTELWQKRSLLNRVVEVKYQELGSQGRLRHPRFSRMRPDKPLAECIYDQLEDNC